MNQASTQNHDAVRSEVSSGQVRKPHQLRQGGFTLGELLLVLVVIGILTVIGFRAVQPIIISGRVQSTATDIREMASSSVSFRCVIRKRRILRKASRMAGSSEAFL